MGKSFQKILALLLVAVFALTGFSNGFAEEADVFDSGITVYGTPDKTPPELVSCTIDKTTIKPGETITMTITATDDISGVYNVWAVFRNFENGRTYDFGPFPQKMKDGIYTDVIEVSPYELDGTFQLEEVMLVDKNQNERVYRSKFCEHLEKDDLLLPQELSFTVTSSNPDSTPPTLKNCSVDKTTVTAPATITMTITATDDISGVYNVWAVFRNFENGRTYDFGPFPQKMKDGIYTDVIEVSPYELDGTFQLEEVMLVDKNQNERIYRSKFCEYLEKDDLLLPQELSFTVSNDSSAVITNTSNPGLADAVKNMENGKTAAVNYEGNPHISADVFDAIKGTDKKLVLESEGIQWIFNGRDIKTSKDLDLKVDISPLDRTPSANAGEIEKLVKDTPTMVLSFPDNGQLPGLAKIRIKADYTFRKLLGTKNLNVYYYDNTEKKLKLISSNVNLTNDIWLEFSTDHNSDFVVTSKNTGSSRPDHSDDSDDSTSQGTSVEQPAQTVKNPNTGRL